MSKKELENAIEKITEGISSLTKYFLKKKLNANTEKDEEKETATVEEE